jgi:hypothetical protein
MVHPDMKALQKGIIAAKTETDLREIVQAAVGPSGFMEFVRFDLGEVLCGGGLVSTRATANLALNYTVERHRFLDRIATRAVCVLLTR